MKRAAVYTAGVTGSAGVLTADGPRERASAYSSTMQVLHWGTATLLLGVYVAAWSIDGATDRADRMWLVMLHRSLGIVLLLVTGLRLLIRSRTDIPPLPADLPLAQRLAARFSIISLYTSLISQPLLGLAASVLHGGHAAVFGGFELPRLLPQDRPLAHALFHVHQTMAALFLATIGVHIAAALYHHFVRKDQVLAGMLPTGRMPRGGAGGAP